MPEDPKRPLPVHNPQKDHRDIVFSHPSEEEFAKILDFFAIEWDYEPTTFPLRWDEDGNVLEAFSPDFYLVDQDEYIELTTLRQRLIRFKRKKLARLRELYPEVSARLWTRRDFNRFLERFEMEDRSEDLIGQQASRNSRNDG